MVGLKILETCMDLFYYCHLFIGVIKVCINSYTEYGVGYPLAFFFFTPMFF